MNIEILSVFAALVLTVSMATERVVLAFRSIPGLKWLNSPKGSANKEGVRSLILQAVALLVAWVTSGFLHHSGEWNLLGSVHVGAIDSTTSLKIPVFLLALLSLGGSSLWKNILGYTKAVRDIKREVQKKEANSEDLVEGLLKTQAGATPAPKASRKPKAPAPQTPGKGG